MTVQLTSKSFRDVLTLSGLLPEDTIRQLIDRFPDQAATADQFARLLLQQNLLTQWQADKLLQAKHRGFFLGPYKLRRLLARGGMSTIYVAEEVASGRVCALKVLPLARVDETSYLSRFRREASIASRLQHPNIVRVFGIHCESDGRADVHFMAMELLHGSDLHADVGQHGPLSVWAAVDAVRQAALGLDYAHAHDLVHRDIKPGNLFLNHDGEIRILDLGLASRLEGQQEDLTRQFNERVLGTADYLAPEQAVDSHLVDGRADIYALGATFYFLLTGQPPFVGGSLAQRILAHQTKQPQPVSELRPEIPAELEQLLSQMLVKQRDQRIQSAGEVAQACQRWQTAHAAERQFRQRPAAASPGLKSDNNHESRPGGSRSRQQDRRSLTDEPGGFDTQPCRILRPAETDSSRTDFTDSSPQADDEHSAEKHLAVGTPSRDARYTPEFHDFLEQLDLHSGELSVMSGAVLAERRQQASYQLANSEADSDAGQDRLRSDDQPPKSLPADNDDQSAWRGSEISRRQLMVPALLVSAAAGLVWVVVVMLLQ